MTQFDASRGHRRGWAIAGLLAVFAALPVAALAAWTSVMPTLMP